MGTNFYAAGHRHDESPEYHIGKRSAAGLYCWDCGRTLCQDGEKHVHHGCSAWDKKCTMCGKSPVEESLEDSSGGRELGFNKSAPAAKTGVGSCSSFTWAMTPERFARIRSVIDEYGRKMSKADFVQMLSECPIQFYDMIGREFN